MSKVDVIIPAYNAACYLPAAIDSVEAQSFEDWRIVLVDDGSTDDTAAVTAPYRERLGPKMKYIKKPNGGLPAARNTAIQNSSSEYLALLDADDIWLPWRLEESVKSLQHSPNAGLSYGMIACLTPDRGLVEGFDKRQEGGEGWIAPNIFMRKIQLPCPTMTFRRKCIEDVGYFDETMRATEDRDMWFRIALKYEVRFVERVIAQYRVSANSMTTDPSRMLKAQLQFVEKHRGAPGCGTRECHIALAGVYRQYAEALAARGERWAALKNGARAFALYPFDAHHARTAGSLALQFMGLGR